MTDMLCICRFLVDMPPGAVFVVVGIVLRSAEGVGWAMGNTTTLALLPYLYPSRVGLLSGLLLGFEGLGYSIAPPIGSLFASEGDYHVPFWMVGGIIIILSPLVLLLVKPPESLTAKCVPFSVVVKLLRDFNFSMLFLTIVISYSAMTFMDVTLALYLRKIGLSLVQIGIAFGIMEGSYVLFVVPFGKLSDIFGTRKFIISGLFMEATSLMIIGVTPYILLPNQWIVVSALVILGCAIAQVDIPAYCELLHKAHSLHPTTEEEKDALTCTVSAIASFSMSLGEFLGALLGGLLTHLTDFPTAVLMLGETVAANAILVLGVSLIDFIAEYMSPTQTT
jgi:MFS family permease